MPLENCASNPYTPGNINSDAGSSNPPYYGSSGSLILIPSNANLVLSTFVPTVVLGTGIREPAAANLLLSTTAPTVSIDATGTFVPATANLLLSSLAPTVSISDNIALSPASANLVLSSVAPTVQSAAWTPADISTLAWYDASDSNNVTLTGSDVDQWDDLSGNGNHVTQTTTANKPDYTTSGGQQIDGKNTISFDGSDDMLIKNTVVGFPTNNTTAISAVCVFRARSLADRGFFDFSSSTTDTNRTALLLAEDNIGGISSRSGSSSNGASISSFADTTDAHVWSSVHKTNDRQIRLDGGTATTNTTTNSTFSYTNLKIGRLMSNVYPMLGDWAELIIFSGTDSTTREKCEGYLAHKWGLEGNLPGGHPYKSAPP